jgi:hypothetical protein
MQIYFLKTHVKSIKLSSLLPFCALAFVLGWFAPKALEATGLIQSKAQQANGANAKTTSNIPDALNKFKAIKLEGNNNAGREELSQLAPALANNPELRSAALEKFAKASDSSVRNELSYFLAHEPVPEIIAVATEWFNKTDDDNARTNGLRLLSRLSEPPPEVYKRSRELVEKEKDPEVLALAVWNLSPQGIPDPVEVAFMVPLLHAFTQHSSPELRMASIQRLAEWDRARRYFVQDVLRLLSDQEEDVRAATIGATSIARLNDELILRKFMSMLTDKTQPQFLRDIVLLQLDGFALTPNDYAIYLKTRQELHGDATK